MSRDLKEFRRIRLAERPVERYVGGDLPQLVGPGVSQWSGERDVKAQIERGSRVRFVAGETVYDASASFGAAFLHDADGSCVRVPRPSIGCVSKVHDDRFSRANGPFDLACKYLLLCLAGRVVIVKK